MSEDLSVCASYLSFTYPSHIDSKEEREEKVENVTESQKKAR
jgi:hypothetical protein